MYRQVADVISKMVIGDEFRFNVLCPNGEEERVCAKYIQEFDSMMVIIGILGGGENMVFLLNENLTNWDSEIDFIHKEMNKNLKNYQFIGFHSFEKWSMGDVPVSI